MTRIRIIAALIMAPGTIAAVLLLPTPWMMLAAAIVFLAALWEWFALAEIEDSLARSALLVLNLLLMVALVWGTGGTAATLVLFKLAVVLGVVWWLLAMLWLVHYDFASDHDTNARVFKLAAATFAVVPAWCALALLHNDGPAWLLLVLMTVWATDTGAYFAGRAFGKRKLAPRISPNKTWAGLIGGAVGAGLFGWATAFYFEMEPIFHWLGGPMGLIAQAGDLYESWVKRRAGVKDSGTLLPGHGGVLDRLDGLLAVALATTLLLMAGMWTA